VQLKEIQLIELRTHNSKFKYDKGCEFEDLKNEVLVLKQNLAERDCRYKEIETKYALSYAELQAKMLKATVDIEEQNSKLKQ
jgi:hypothetical protein